MNLWIPGLLLGAAVLALIFYARVVVPFQHLRVAVRRLAARDFRPVLLEARSGIFHETALDLRRIAELLQQLDQRTTDEGFNLRAILSGMVEGVVITDRSQRIRLFNDALCRMLALRQPPLGGTVMEAFHNHELRKTLEQTLGDGITRQFETSLEVQGPQGYTLRHLEVSVGGLNPSLQNQPSGAVVVFHDITKIKALEAVRREFVANVSHEFRTPLTIINGSIETLLDGALDDRPASEKFLKAMARNGERMTLLIDDLLAISQMENRAVRMDFQPTDLPALLDRVLDRLEPALTARQARIVLDWPPTLPPAEVDAARIEQVFSNLLENALRHSSSDGVILTVSARSRDALLEMTFADNGPGIPAPDLPHIFERFYRVQKDRSRNGGGTGLGLSIVKQIVLCHGGTIAAESRPGEGATFRITLPITQTPPGAAGAG